MTTDELFQKILNENPPKIVKTSYKYDILGGSVEYIAIYKSDLKYTSGSTEKYPYISASDASQFTLGSEYNQLQFKKDVIKACFDEQIKEIINE